MKFKNTKVPERDRRQFNNLSDIKPSPNHLYHLKFSLPYIKNRKVLDVGCWSGQFDILAVKFTQQITGIDPSKDAISFAKKTIPEGKFLVGVADKLPLPKNSFDTVCFFQVMEHLPKGTEVDALKEIYRVLKPQGTLLLSVPNKNFFSILTDPAYFLLEHRHYSLENITSFLNQSGFKLKLCLVRGGVLETFIQNLYLILKHLFKVQPLLPSILSELILNEYKRNGFWCLYIVANKS